MSPSISTPGQHLSEIIASAIGFELVSLAHGGMSNCGICIQIDTAIAQRADFVLVNTTQCERMEIRLGPEHIRSHPFRTSDMLYSDPAALSTVTLPNGSNAGMISQSMRSLIDGSGLQSYPEKKAALTEYLNEIYDDGWKHQVDTWCMYAMLHKLHLSGIPYLLVLDGLGVINHCPFIGDNTTLTIASIFYDSVMAAAAIAPGFRDPGYHTLPEAQQHAAAHILTYMRANPRIFSSLGLDRLASRP